MVSTYIDPTQIILNQIIRQIKIEVKPWSFENELRIDIDEVLLLEAASMIVKSIPEEIRSCTGKEESIQIDKVWIKIGNHNIKANWKTEIETHHIKKEIGFTKE